VTYNNPIARTLFYRPQLPSDYLERSAVLEKLDSRDHPALILVSAAAGFGKSSLLSHWLSSRCLNFSWYSLSKYDNDLQRFINYCVRSIQNNFKTFGTTLLELCNAPQMPDLKLISDYLDEELATLKAPFYLVLDDFHVINNPDIHQLVIQLCSMRHRHFHMVISTRRDPAFPIGEWRSKNMVLDIRSSNLQFSREETRTFLMKAIPKSQSTDFTDELDRTFGGWAAGLRLFILSTETHRPDNLPHVGDEFENLMVVNQLIHSILEKQSPKHQEFLLKLSLVEEFNQELFNSLCVPNEDLGESSVHFEKFLEACFASNMFIRALDDRHRWYSFHNLFRQLLGKKWSVEAGEGTFKEQYRVAGQWYEKQGMNAEAIQFYLKGEHVNHAIQVFKQGRKELLSTGRWISLEYIMASFSDEIIKTTPVLLLQKAWQFIIKNNIIAMVKLLEPMDELMARADMDPAEEKQFKGELCVLKAYNHYLIEVDMGKSLESSEEALALLNDSSPNVFGFAWIFYGGAMQSLNRAVEARERIYGQFQATENPVLRAQLLLVLCYIDWFEGDQLQLEKTSWNLVQLGTESGLKMALAHGYYFSGLACYRTNRIPESRTFLELCLPHRHHALQVINFGITDTLARVYTELGQNDSARNMVLQNHKDSLDRGGEKEGRYSQALEMDLKWRTQRHPAALQWAGETDYTQVLPIVSYSIPSCTQAEILAEDTQASSWNKALLISRLLLPILKERNNRNFLARVQAIEALALFRLGDLEQSCTSLKAAIKVAERGTHIKTFFVGGKEMLELLRFYEKTKSENRFIKQLISEISRNVRNGKEEAVTSREVQILKLLDENLTNKEIGGKLYISETTVKKHITNLNRKLDTRSRMETLRRAKDLALF